MAFLISVFFLLKRKEVFKYWIYGAILASVYAWYLFFSSALGIPYLKLFGMAENPQTIMGIVRAGTFREGNFFGLYLILSAAIAFHLKRNRIAWFLMITILSTFSTVSLISATLFLMIYFKRILFSVRNLKKLVIVLPVLIVGLFFFFKSEFYTKYIEQKLFTPVSVLTTSNFSKVDRYLTANIAFKAGIDNPIFGVGPYNYGLHYDHYNNIDEIVENQSEYSITFFERQGKRAIPNNIYLEVWSEYGVLGFLFFIMFLINTLYISYKNKNLIITAGLVAMYVSFIAFPSFIMLFIWVYLAVPYALHFKDKKDKILQSV
ncbi:O-antigen ligase family protein [Flagellimonas sp.]|uniref:O-antigen ligase family protein n=1 Tax=Flagellimonas sp. TaxID=2058762 RepID=UPI003F4A7970